MTTKYTNAPSAWRGRQDVIIMPSSWDAWVNGDNLTIDFGVAATMYNSGFPSDITLKYSFRAPLKSDGTAWLNNWHYDQSVFDDQLAQLAKFGAGRWILAYPNRADISSGVIPFVSDIYDNSIARWLASPNKNLAPLALVIFSDWASYDVSGNPGTWLNYSAFVTRWVSLCGDARYLRLTYGGVANRPLIGLYDSQNKWQDNLSRLTTLTNAVTAAGMGAPVYCQMNADATASNAIGCQYITAYIPNIAANTQSSFLTMAKNCKKQNLTGGATASRTGYLAQKFDNRPRSSANPWADTPLYTESEQLWRDTFATARAAVRANPNALVHMNSLSEIDESGPFFMTAQDQPEGVNTPTLGPSVDAVVNVWTGAFPATYTDYYMAWSFHADVGGSLPAGWAIVQGLPGTAGGLTGSREYAVIRNTTTTNARTWTTKTTRFRVWGTLGPGLGHISFIVDGGATVDVNQDDGGGTTRYNQLLFDSGALSNASHTLAVNRVSGQAEFCRVGAGRSR